MARVLLAPDPRDPLGAFQDSAKQGGVQHHVGELLEASFPAVAAGVLSLASPTHLYACDCFLLPREDLVRSALDVSSRTSGEKRSKEVGSCLR